MSIEAIDFVIFLNNFSRLSVQKFFSIFSLIRSLILLLYRARRRASRVPLLSIKSISNNIFSNIVLKNNLADYVNNEDKEIKYDLIINSTIIKTITSKNKKGNPEAFSMEITINVDIHKAENLINQTTLKENFEYKNKSSKFELKQYEKNIKKNLTSKLSRDIIEYLYSIK